MLSGTPNVVTDTGDGVLVVGETGWVVPPRSPEELAEAIEAAWDEWKNRPGEWQERREAARRRVAEDFSFDKMAKAYEDAWVALAGRQSRRARRRLSSS